MKRFGVVLWVLIFIALIGGVVLVTGSWNRDQGLAQIVSTKQVKKENCELVVKSREFNREPYYNGPLIDDHLHMPVSSSVVSSVSVTMGLPSPSWDKTLTTDYLNCLSESLGTKQTIGFYLLTKFSSAGEVSMAKKIEKKYPGKIAHFLMPSLFNSFINVDAKTFSDALEKNPNLFKGIGEIKTFDNRELDDPFLMELYGLAEKHKLIVMIHPFHHQKAKVEKILKQYSKVNFLFHGGEENANIIFELMKSYPNAYYSLDADITSIYGWERQNNDNQPNREQWLAYVRKNFDGVLDQSSAERWKRRLESFPDRVLWGTDRWYRWHFDTEVVGLINEISRNFIGRLDLTMQEKFAYKNAQKLFNLR
ncbi:MAG: amidohydrolase family protein [bacterium]|nr:amidohydrolase family protein [bacterium]